MDIKEVSVINKVYANTFQNNDVKEEQENSSKQYDGRYNNNFSQSLSQSKGIKSYEIVNSFKNARKVEAMTKSNKYNDLETEEKYKRVDILA
jgi:hypothetical protein